MTMTKEFKLLQLVSDVLLESKYKSLIVMVNAEVQTDCQRMILDVAFLEKEIPRLRWES